MEFQEVVRKRRMVRHFTNEPVEAEVLQRILDLARHAPSAGYTQGQSFIVVTRPEIKQKIADLCGEEEYAASGYHRFISEAPVVIVPCTNEAAYHRRYQESDKLMEDGAETIWPVPFWFMDIGCSIMVILLAVVNEGLAAGFVGVDDLAAIRSLLNIPPEVTPMGIVPVGHQAQDKPSPSLTRGRKPIAETVRWEGW